MPCWRSSPSSARCPSLGPRRHLRGASCRRLCGRWLASSAGLDFHPGHRFLLGWCFCLQYSNNKSERMFPSIVPIPVGGTLVVRIGNLSWFERPIVIGLRRQAELRCWQKWEVGPSARLETHNGNTKPLIMLRAVAEVDEHYPNTLSRTERLTRWAERLESNPNRRLFTLHQTEYQSLGIRGENARRRHPDLDRLSRPGPPRIRHGERHVL